MSFKSVAIQLMFLASCLLGSAPPASSQSLQATYLGGSGGEGWQYSGAVDVALADDGTVYVAGVTSSSDFPVTPAAYICTSRGQDDFFVARFNSDLTELLAATVVGGTGGETYPNLCLASDGSVYLAGATLSANFPTTAGAYDRIFGGNNDAVVAKFDANLSTLVAATFLGGSGNDISPNLALDGEGNAILVVQTASSYYADFLVSKLSPDLSQLLASRLLGGQYSEQWPSVAVDPDGNIIVAGASESGNYPTTAGAFCEVYHGTPAPGQYKHDVVVSKLNPDLSSLLASTYVGTNGFEGSGDLCLDNQGNIFVSGHTEGVDYPVTPGAYDTEHTGGNEYYVTKLSNDLTTILASTFFTPGDATFSFGTNMTCDASGNLVMVGAAWDEGCPVTAYAYDRTFNGGEGDIFVRVMSPDLTAMTYGTFLGSPGGEGDACVRVTSQGVVYLATYTTSADFPVSLGAYDSDFNGGDKDAVVARLRTELFTRVTEGPLVNDSEASAGVCMVDYDQDGLNDIYVVKVAESGAANTLYRNTGNATFEEVTGQPIVEDIAMSYGASWADFESDGDLDVATATFLGSLSQLYLNDGSGGFAAASFGPVTGGTVGSTSASWTDYDLDNDLDLFIANSTNSYSYPAYVNFLFRNDGGVLNRVTSGIIATHSRHTYGVSWADYDNDGDPDLVNTNNVSERTDLFINNGNGSFTLAPSTVLGTDGTNVGGCSWADYDNDGDLDLYIAAYYPGPSILYRNDGGGVLSRVADHGLGILSGRARSGIWADFDNDGDQDIFVWLMDSENLVNSHGYIFENFGDGTFNRLSETLFECDSCTVWSAVSGDIDGDGDMDLFLGKMDPQWQARPGYLNDILYLNNGNGNHWITVKPVGVISNRSAVGAKVRVKAVINGQPVWQLQELQTMTGLRAQSPLELHFGLGDATVIDSLKLEWPSGIVQVLESVAVDRYLTVNEYESCCEGRVGDADGSNESTDEVTLGDIMLLVDVKFISSDCSKLPCLAEADASQDGGDNPNCEDHITLGDIMTLVDFLFITGPQNATLPECLSSSGGLMIPRGAGVTIDGVLQPGEWIDAKALRLGIDGVVDVAVLVKHDGTNLLAAYSYSLVGGEGLCMPEILIDSENDKNSEWQYDDWWFHVSATDCEARGTYDVYTDCSVVQPDWQGVPNFAMAPNPAVPLDTFEIRIPLSKIGVSVGNTIGIAFRVEFVPMMFGYWPPSGEANSPATWGNAIIEP